VSLYPDLYVGIVFGIISILICLYVSHIRIKDIVLRYNAEQERDIDSLTGMKNNNAYQRMVSNLMEKARKANFEFTLVVFDINRLKQTNDNYGHECGDKLLSRAAFLISDSFPNGYVFRIGGDEFATFLTGGDHENRKTIVANFKKRVEEIHDQSKELKDDTSIACGYANYNSDVDRDYVSLFARADASMYDNKKNIKLKNGYIIDKSAK
jgi:diguanylate cyclase (GGDEF)-like protein